jgi:hypothetical protein
LSVRVIASGLMPAQIEAIAHCWNETLSKSPMADKIRLISFLILLGRLPTQFAASLKQATGVIT